jgi:hypothetical protein
LNAKEFRKLATLPALNILILKRDKSKAGCLALFSTNTNISRAKNPPNARMKFRDELALSRVNATKISVKALEYRAVPR